MDNERGVECPSKLDNRTTLCRFPSTKHVSDQHKKLHPGVLKRISIGRVYTVSQAEAKSYRAVPSQPTVTILDLCLYEPGVKGRDGFS